MNVGDKVYLEDRESEIIAISYDEQGEKIYTVKNSPKDYYEHDFYEFMHSELHATQNLLEEYKEAYVDYQELGKEYAKLQDELEELKKKYDGLVALNRASLEEYEEQEKIIDLMAQDIEKITGSCPFDLHDYQIEDCDHICQKLADNGKQYTCFIEYYEKKVKGE